MPKFSDEEKDKIKQKLLIEGERLFTTFGVRKVSIDELVKATGIAKGSFYSFFPSKEHLFWNLSTKQHEKMWRDMEDFLQLNKDLLPVDLLKEAFFWMFDNLKHYPLVQSVDNETKEYLFRKLPKEVMDSHTRDDGEELLKLQKYGIEFTCDISVAAKILQSLLLALLNIQQEDEETRISIMNTMLDGVLKEIVKDTK